jgi:hypothetical protein
MQRLEVSGPVRPLKWPLGVKWLREMNYKFIIHYDFFWQVVMYVEIHNEKKIFSRHELLKLHSLQPDLTALKIESTVYSETHLTNYQLI